MSTKSKKPKVTRRVRFAIDEDDVEEKPKTSAKRKRQPSNKKDTQRKNNSSPPKKILKQTAVERYPEGYFDPIKKFEKIFGSDDITEEQINKEKERVSAGCEKVLAESEIAENEEFAELFEDETDDISEEDELSDNSDEADSSFDECPDLVEVEYMENPPLIECAEGFEWDPEEEETNMRFFVPLAENVIGKERRILSNTPLVHDYTDDYRLNGKMYEKFDAVHGHLADQYRTSHELLFKTMVELLPGTRNPDVFYYTLYLLFPNQGSQRVFSDIFPELVKSFVQDEAEQERLLKLEHWKTPDTKKDRRYEDPVDFKNPFSHGNYLSKSIQLPPERPTTFCSEKCYNTISKLELLVWASNIGPISANNSVKVFIEKSIRKDCDFFNTLILGSENVLVDNFCHVARDFSSKSCIEWFKYMMRVSVQPTETELNEVAPKKDFKQRDKSFRYLMTADTARLEKKQKLALKEKTDNGDQSPKCPQRSVGKDVLHTKVFLTPCCHLGPCGPEVPSCSCDMICSPYCLCDADCARRFPGCTCKPGTCSTMSCPCSRLGWECVPGLCKQCPDVDHPENPDSFGCKNKYLTYNIPKAVTIKKSGIAGNGAFIDEDVKKGAFIGEYTGEYISDEESERRGAFYDIKISYVFTLATGCGSIDADSCGSLMRFLNHASNPNCVSRLLMVHGKMRLGFFALKAIKAGTELTLNYAYDSESANRFFNMTPEERIPKLSYAPKESSSTSKPLYNVIEEDSKFKTDLLKTTTVTRSGRVSKRYSLAKSAKKSKTEAIEDEPSTSLQGRYNNLPSSSSAAMLESELNSFGIYDEIELAPPPVSTEPSTSASYWNEEPEFSDDSF